jgi:amino acid transporter
MSKTGFIRALGLTDATLLVIGCIVGVGIFRTASSIAGHVPSPALILALWLAGGLLSMCGALCYAELASVFPASGGDYVYLREIYGAFWGFLFGWTKLFIERTGTIAVLAFVFAEYVRRIVPYGEWTLRIVAGIAIVGLTAVNIAGIRWGKYVQNLFAGLKIAALGAIIVAGMAAVMSQKTASPSWNVPLPDVPLLQSLGVALVFVIWTYGGWTEAAYVAEEVKEPTRNVPKAIIGGVALTTVLYLLVNWSYLLFIPIERMPQTPLVASSVMQAVLGEAGAAFIACMIACSAFGALNGYILTGGRILYAVGKDHVLFNRLGAIHPRFHTPALALWTNALIAIGLVFTKTFEQIMTYSTVVISVFFALAVVGVIVLRRTQPSRPRPYKAWGYPLTPVVFVLVMIAFIADVCIKQPREAVFGFGFLACGLLLYWGSRTWERLG